MATAKAPQLELQPTETKPAATNAPATKPATDVKPAPKQEPVTPSTTVQIFHTEFSKYQNKILPRLLAKHGIEPEQFVQIVMDEVKTNPDLLEAFRVNPMSMFASILAGAKIGLIPSAITGEFFLIPRKIDSLLTVCPQIGYKGLCNVLLRSGDVIKLHSECVFEGDEFTPLYGLEPNIIHKPNFDVPRTADKIKYVYAVAKLKTGDYQFAVLNRADITKIMQMSKYENGMYFNDKKDPMHWMVRKVALVQLGKMLPKDYYGKAALDLHNQIEGGNVIYLDENNEVVFKKGNATPQISKAKFPNFKDTFGQLPQLPETQE